MTIVASTKCLMLLKDLHKMQTFHLKDRSMKIWTMMWDVSSWWCRGQRELWASSQTNIGFLVSFEDNYGALSWIALFGHSIGGYFYHPTLSIALAKVFATIWRFWPWGVHLSQTTLECQIQVTRYLDLIFPYLKFIEVQPKDATWSEIRDLIKFLQNARRVK